jgi:hypothetical protein
MISASDADPGSAKQVVDRLRRTESFADPGSAKHVVDRLRRTRDMAFDDRTERVRAREGREP